MNSIKYLLSSLTILLFLTSCEDKTFTRVYGVVETPLVINSVNLSSIYPDVKSMVEISLKREDLPIKKDASYTIKVDFMNYKKACNNPMTSAYDATYSGFIRLTLLKDSKRIYMCQKEFRGELSIGVIDDLLALMRDDLEF